MKDKKQTKEAKIKHLKAKIHSEFLDHLKTDPNTNIFDFLVSGQIKVGFGLVIAQPADLDELVFMLALNKRMFDDSKTERDFFYSQPVEFIPAFFDSFLDHPDPRVKFLKKLPMAIEIQQTKEEVDSIHGHQDEENLTFLTMDIILYETMEKLADLILNGEEENQIILNDIKNIILDHKKASPINAAKIEEIIGRCF